MRAGEQGTLLRWLQQGTGGWGGSGAGLAGDGANEQGDGGGGGLEGRVEGRRGGRSSGAVVVRTLEEAVSGGVGDRRVGEPNTRQDTSLLLKFENKMWA